MTKDLFNLSGRAIVITGGGGLMGRHHALAIARQGGLPVLLDQDQGRLENVRKKVFDTTGIESLNYKADVTREDSLKSVLESCLSKKIEINGLINNAAIDAKVGGASTGLTRLENMSLEKWDLEVAVGLTGAFLCSRIFGSQMAKTAGGVILNIASDLGIIAPDQRLYRQPGLSEEQQPVKPVTYSVIKHGLIGLTRYLATYWADKNIRVNALCPGGIQDKQSDEFLLRIKNLIPMGRMASEDEYEGAVVFLCSDASKYMTGQILVMDGGRSVW